MDKRASSERKYLPNHRLREERERRGLAHRDIAEYIGLPDPHTVGRWERGVSFPHPHYRQKLCQLYGKSAEALGLVRIRFDEGERPCEPAFALGEQTEAGAPVWKMPSTVTSFIGRERDNAAVCALLRRADVRLVTLLGPGGVGKTRLSIAVGTEMAKDFADGVCFVSLAAITDHTLVFPTIASTLGIPERGTSSSGDLMKSALHAKRLLLILDNFEQIVTASPLLEELLMACPALKVLVTSRSALRLGIEQRYNVEPLALPDTRALPTPESLMQYAAIALFVQRAQALLPSFQPTQENSQVIAEICARLDGLPLALELAAARIKLLPPRSLLARLSQGLQFLKNELPNQAKRQYTLYSTIEWSYNLLQEHEQWLFRHLCVFPGGCVPEAIEAILWSEQTTDLLDTLASLIDKSLLQQVEQDGETPRFVMLATVREYGLVCLQARNELEQCQQKQAMYYLAFVEQARPYLNGMQQTTWLAALEKEKANLYAAITCFIRREETDAALHFCEAFGKFCGLRGYWSEEQHWLHAALRLPWTAGSAGIRARVLRRAGHLAYRLRNLPLARGFLEESALLSRSVADRQNLAGALGGLGWVLYRQKDLESASQCLNESITAARESGDGWAIANALESLGRFLHLRGDTNGASRLLKESVSLARELGDQENLARILTTLVSIELAQGNLVQADLLAQESYELAQRMGTKPLMALTLDSLGDVALFLGEYEWAEQLLEERILLARELGDTATIALKQLRLGEIALARENLVQATIHAQEGLLFFREQGDTPNIAAALGILGDITRTRGDFSQAVACYAEASSLAREVGYKKEIGRGLIGLAMVSLAQGQIERAARLFGFVEARATSSSGMHPAQRLAYTRAIEQARVHTQAPALQAAWIEGSSMTIEEAMALSFPAN